MNATGWTGARYARLMPGTPGDMAGIELRSSAFNDHSVIERRYAYEGDNVSPPLAWRGVPDDATELVLLCEDPDAPSGTFAHWIVVGIDPHSEGVAAGQCPTGGTELVNGYHERGWGGPHPPPGDEAHRYFFRLYALSKPCVLPDAPSAQEVHQAVDEQQLASGTLVGLYQR
ncbi:Raf kinase inhibitor-like YbhB/YbcL family protein [Streptomyces sp. V4I2]|nr:Raf kinase inhibitor-like YbhB/YbcL family protein [Streptomyces sp. V4I2]